MIEDIWKLMDYAYRYEKEPHLLYKFIIQLSDDYEPDESRKEKIRSAMQKQVDDWMNILSDEEEI